MQPAEVNRTLFRCATDSPQRSLAAWRELTARLEFESLADCQRRLLPAVYKNLCEQGAIPWKGPLHNLYRYTWARNHQLQKAGASVVRLLAESGIPTLVLKGLALNHSVYGDMGMRPAHDFDLLVPFDQAGQALRVLLAAGWTWPVDPEARDSAILVGQAASLRKDGLELDLHWLALREAGHPQWDRVLWEKSVELPLGETTARTLCPTHQLIHLLVNGSREPQHQFRYALDLHALRARLADQIDAAQVRHLLAERRLLHRLSYLPLELSGWEGLREGPSPGWLDRLWSWSSRCLHDGSGELAYALFPFLDYRLHYLGHAERPSFAAYLRHHLKARSWSELLRRGRRKLARWNRRPPRSPRL